jgi:orotidine-5'-phosphate decarboxylase
VNAADRVLLALDVPGETAADAIVARVGPEARGVKVGKQLFLAAGPGLVRRLVESGRRVFLDLKFHDIPNTVAGATREAVKLGVAFLDVHAAGGREMMRAAADAASDEATRLGSTRPKLLAVTVLTSLDAEALRETGVGSDLEAQVLRLARLAREAGMDGVVASPREIAAIRKELGGDFLIVTPGIRAGGVRDDQKRTLTAREAILAGADYLVMGRPVLLAADPAAAFAAVVAEIGEAIEHAAGRGGA